MILTILLGSTALLFAGWRIWRRMRFSLHVCQLHGYKVGEYGGWLVRRPFDYVIRLSHILGGALLLLSLPLSSALEPHVLTWLMLLLWSVFFASSRRYRSEQVKKPLAWTHRMQRLCTLTAVITLVPIVAAATVVAGSLPGALDYDVVSGTRRALLFLLQADIIAPLAVILAVILLEPLEAAFRAGFKRRARKALADHEGLTVIGITGSYGKTSVKFIIEEILSQRFQVLATPGSYNTPMGICKVINNDLKPHHQVLVVEMGMRHKGDIAELCDLVQPHVGVVTNVGIAHLESMKTIEAIAREKGTLVRRIPRAGTVVLNADDPRVASMTEDSTASTVITVSARGDTAGFSAHDISYGPDGASFTVREAGGGAHVFSTQLLGKHNVTNILLGIAVGHSMGLRLRQMAHAVRRVEPVPHRLQLRREGTVIVIDDAFNSNPVGAGNAVEILGQFRTGRRVIVTPGMVELGEREEEENRTFGEATARNVDLAVLVGPERTKPIYSGLVNAGFPEEQIRVVNSLFEARDFLKGYLRDGDVVLYENDLPDQYDETS